MFRRAMLPLLLLTSACSNQMPLSKVPQPVGVLQAADSSRSTQGALDLIDQIAVAQPQEYAHIEAEFDKAISQSTRPSLKVILAHAAQVMTQHPIPGLEASAHPISRLVRLATWRHNYLSSNYMIPRALEILALAQAEPAAQETQLQSFEKRLRSTPKQDVKVLLQLLAEGSYDNLFPSDSLLHQRLVTILEARLAA